MELLPGTEPLAFVAIYIPGELVRTKNGNIFLLAITDSFTKLNRTVPLKYITETDMAHAFVHHWVFVYGPPRTVLSDNQSQFTARFFTEMCRTIGTKNFYTTTYHLQSNEQVEWFSRTMLPDFRNYLSDQPGQWDLSTNSLTYVYNTQVHRTTNIAPFQMVV